MLIGRRLEQNLMNSHWLSCCSFLKCAKGWTSSTGNQYVCIWSWIELYPTIKAAREKLEMPCVFFNPFPDRYLQGHTKLKGLVSSWEAHIFQPPLQLWCWHDVLWQSKETPYDFGWKESNTKIPQGIPGHTTSLSREIAAAFLRHWQRFCQYVPSSVLLECVVMGAAGTSRSGATVPPRWSLDRS